MILPGTFIEIKCEKCKWSTIFKLESNSEFFDTKELVRIDKRLDGWYKLNEHGKPKKIDELPKTAILCRDIKKCPKCGGEITRKCVDEEIISKAKEMGID